MGTGKRVDLATEKKKLFQTAPGQYENNFNSTKYKAASWGFGSEIRPEVAPKAVMKNPAPSNYNIASKISEGPAAAMHARCDNIDMNKKNNYPGAGSYDLQNKLNPSMNKAASFSMGSETRDRNPHMKEQKTVPGAGTYAHGVDLKKTSPKFGFGTSKRPVIGFKKDATPAPGHYKVPTKIADVAAYSGVKNAEHKHV